MRKFIAVLGVLAILAVACWNGGEEATPTSGGARTAPAARGEESADETTTEAAAPEPEYPEITIKIGHSGAPDGHADIAAVKFKELVESGSDGLMTVEVFPSSQMGSERDLVEGAQLGFDRRRGGVGRDSGELCARDGRGEPALPLRRPRPCRRGLRRSGGPRTPGLGRGCGHQGAGDRPVWPPFDDEQPAAYLYPL